MDIHAYHSLLAWMSTTKNPDLYFNAYLDGNRRQLADLTRNIFREYLTRNGKEKSWLPKLTAPVEQDGATALNLTTKRRVSILDGGICYNVNDEMLPDSTEHVDNVPLDLSLKSSSNAITHSQFLHELGLRRVDFVKEEKKDTDVVHKMDAPVHPEGKVGNWNISDHFKHMRTYPTFRSKYIDGGGVDVGKSSPSTTQCQQSEINGSNQKSSKQYSCHMCGKSYRQARDFRAHLATHTDGSVFNCDICCRVLYTPSDYLQHLKTHRQKEVMPCPHCGRYFRDSCTLSTHMRTHTGEKPYKCDICGRSFAQTGTYRRHRKGHKMAWVSF